MEAEADAKRLKAEEITKARRLEAMEKAKMYEREEAEKNRMFELEKTQIEVNPSTPSVTSPTGDTSLYAYSFLIFFR